MSIVLKAATENQKKQRQQTGQSWCRFCFIYFLVCVHFWNTARESRKQMFVADLSSAFG